MKQSKYGEDDIVCNKNTGYAKFGSTKNNFYWISFLLEAKPSG